MKYLFAIIFFTIFSVSQVFAQTITIGNIDPGPYGNGSRVAIPFNINDAGGCIAQNNTFSLYMSDATGAFVSATPVATINGFYAAFFNYTIPAALPAGVGYKFMIKASSPAISTAASNAITVNAVAAVAPSALSTSISAANPEVYGQCTGAANTTFNFLNTTAGATAVTASFFNEITQSNDASNVNIMIAGGYNFSAALANYTVTVKAVNAAGTVGTYAYQLINNQVSTNVGFTGNATVCLVAGSAPLTYNIDYTSATGIQNNYPGNLYTFSWGDGSANTVLTLCQIIALSGKVTHPFSKASCGNAANGQNNVFAVNFRASNSFCGNVGSVVTSYAKIVIKPTNFITAVTTACTNSSVDFFNASNPGPDPNASTNTCQNNPNALYIWLIDGVIKGQSYTLAQHFFYTFTTPGMHTVTLRAQNGNGACIATDYTYNICIQDPPQPAFTIPSPACLSNPVIPTDASILDLACSNASAYTYLWTVTGPAGAPAVTFAGGTTKNSIQPQFVFHQLGVYQVQLSISSTCATTSTSQTINVDGPPAITLSADASVCGTNQTYTFGPGGGITQATVTGTAQPTASTYAWTVTGGAYTFANGTSASNQYPKITFTDFGTYTISVTEQNSCGILTKSQTITFQNAPSVSVTPSATNICPGSPVTLTATINGASTSFQWLGSGTFSAPGSLITDYTPTAAEINAGHATITLDVKTGLSGPCADIFQSVTVNINPVNNITSAATKQVCTGNAINYHITSSASGSIYSWTAALTSGTATGFADGGGPGITDIMDVLVNSGTSGAVVTYTITPTANGCTGTPFTLTVTVKPQASVTAAAATDPICSSSQANINLTPNIVGITYTWTSTVTGSITGNTQQTTQISTGVINDVLKNTGNHAESVTYIITPFNASCPGTPVSVTINVLPLPATSRPGTNTQICNQTTYTLDGNNPPSGSGMWSVVPAGTVTFSDPAQPGAIASGLVPGTTYSFTWTISIPGCNPPSSNSVTITDNLPTVGGTTNGDATVCAGSNNGAITLSGQTGAVIRWESSTDNGGTWTNINNTGASQSYANLTQTTQYRVLVQNGSCTSAYSSVTTITVNQPATIATAGPNDVVCNVTQYALHGNIPNLGTGQWTVASGQTGITFSDATQPDATAIGLIPGNTYQFTWTITAATQCPSSSSTVIIKDDAPAVGGTTTGANTVCSGSNSGSITLSGQFGTILRWESSKDNGTSWVAITNTTTSLSYLNLIQTTQYRAILQNGICSIMPSSVTTIQVNPPAPVANAGPSQNLCNATATTLSGNDPGAFPGVWHQIAGPPVTFADSTNYQTAVTGLTGGNTYIFTWTITALAPCTTTQSQVTIKNSNDVVAGFTTVPKNGCGNLTVQFTNTSNSQAGATFVWTFGDGSAPSNVVSPQHTFAQRTDGRDTTYYISLSVSGNCVPRPPVIDSVLVRPATPIARILPNSVSGCGNFAIDVQNLSPGNNTTYDFYLYDGATLVQKITKTDKTNALFNPISTTSPKTFTLYMVATGYCNNTGESVHIPVTISPISIVAQMFVQNNINKGCTPLNVTFINNSSGGNTFRYNIYDSNNNLVNQIVAGTAPLPYTFNTIGTYYVTISASDNCGTVESTPRTRIDVYTAPKTDFIADVTTGCKDIRVNFTNNTVSNDPNIPASSLSYDWDFGDGTAHSFSYTPPVHAYHYTNSPYTVTLTATNTTTTCSSTIVKQSYIIVNAPPATTFTEKPDSVTTIPNYTFSFIDQTKGNPVSWKWTFSDGQTSIKQNPIVTFPDTGLYKATLTTANAFGCDSTVTHNIRINGVPGQLYLPNAFIPTSLQSALRIFMAKGSGIKNWHLQIFNSFGQLVWETTKLDSKGAPVEGWDGTFQGVPASQGVYVWQASATFINGTEWKGMSYNNSSPKRIGSVHLIR